MLANLLLYFTAAQKESDYEQKVRSFIEQTKGDLDYEDKVRKFLEETARWYARFHWHLYCPVIVRFLICSVI